MEKKKSYRHELKYMIPYGDYEGIRRRLSVIMTPDSHVSSDGTYTIRSIYFDNSDDKVLYEKVNGVGQREKFRIRYYDDDLSYIKLEKKIKNNNLYMKCSTQISKEECENILNGDVGWMINHEDDLIKEFYAKMRYQRLKPRVIVSYIREPYVYKAGNVRITFDKEIRTSLYSSGFLTEQINDVIASDTPQDMILEVKYDAFLPEVIRDMIQVPYVRRQAYSKYGVSRRFY